MTTNEQPDIFREDWLACLRAHYLYTLRAGDLNNAEGLRRVLIEAGINEADIEAMAPQQPHPPSPPLHFVERGEKQTTETPLEHVDEEPEQVAVAPAETEEGEIPTITAPLLDEPVIAPDLFSLLTADDLQPAGSLVATEPISPSEPIRLELPLTETGEEGLSSLAKKVRPKPKSNSPQQRSLF